MLFDRTITIEAVPFGIVALRVGQRKGKTLHTEDNIFHRVVRQRLLCVLHMRVNNDEIVRRNRDLLPLHVEHSLSA